MPIETTSKNTMLAALPGIVYAAFFEGGAPGVGVETVPATLWGAGNRPAVTLGAPVAGARTPDGDAPLGTVAAATTVTHVGYYDAAIAGNLIGYAAYARAFVISDVVKIPDAGNVFTLSDPA